MTSLRAAIRGIHSCVPRFRGSHLLDRVQAIATDVATRANTVTGYTDIEQIKQRIKHTETEINGLKNIVETNRKNYAHAVTNHSNVQRAINDLLHRKSEWTAKDVDRLSELYKEDHATEKLLEEAKQNTEAQETSLEHQRVLLGQLIMDRYREEQIWSDKIRQFSTWGTMILMAVNVLFFITVQLFVEPWKRRRLVTQFEQQLAKSTEKEVKQQELPPVALDDTFREINTVLHSEATWKEKFHSIGGILSLLWGRISQHMFADKINTPIAIAVAYLWLGCLTGFFMGKL